MLGCIEGAGRRGIKREKSTRSPRFLKWPLEVEEDMAEREHRASKAGKTGITEHNEQCTRIQKGSDMTDEDKRDLNNRIAFYEWKDLQQACEEVEEQLDAALGAYWPHLIIPKPRLALSSYSTARSFAFAKSISVWIFLGRVRKRSRGVSSRGVLVTDIWGKSGDGRALHRQLS
jgi:hypothetical protein